jgi:hypothetical protein
MSSKPADFAIHFLAIISILLARFNAITDHECKERQRGIRLKEPDHCEKLQEDAASNIYRKNGIRRHPSTLDTLAEKLAAYAGSNSQHNST